VSVRGGTRKLFAAQWPIVLVVAVFVIAFALAAANFWRRGALMIGIGVLLAAVLRLVLSDERSGLLVVRSRGGDVAATAAIAAAMFYIAWTIDPLGTK
jgi:apolipoprotein N-acyltransferase